LYSFAFQLISFARVHDDTFLGTVIIFKFYSCLGLSATTFYGDCILLPPDVRTATPAFGVPKLHTFQLLLFVHKVFHHPEKLPEVFQDYFEINDTFHCHHT